MQQEQAKPELITVAGITTTKETLTTLTEKFGTEKAAIAHLKDQHSRAAALSKREQEESLKKEKEALKAKAEAQEAVTQPEPKGKVYQEQGHAEIHDR